ncbi:MAG: hypothetical protein EDM05_008445 [Leptolyngbya sp. IPPAS B-1204]
MSQSYPRRSRPWRAHIDRCGQLLTTLLVERLPRLFEPLLAGLGRRQILLLIISLLMLFMPLITIRPNLWQQSIVAVVVIGMGRWLLHLEERQPETRASEYLHLLLLTLSILTTLRYLYYRASYTLNLGEPLDAVFSLLLFLAELYGVGTLFLAYFQTMKTRDRRPVDLNDIPVEQWFTVDVYIPTYNEDVEIVRKTALAALALDYPTEKSTFIFSMTDELKNIANGVPNCGKCATS